MFVLVGASFPVLFLVGTFVLVVFFLFMLVAQIWFRVGCCRVCGFVFPLFIAVDQFSVTLGFLVWYYTHCVCNLLVWQHDRNLSCFVVVFCVLSCSCSVVIVVFLLLVCVVVCCVL